MCHVPVPAASLLPLTALPIRSSLPACSAERKSLMLNWILLLAVRVEPGCSRDVEQFQVGRGAGTVVA